MQFVYRILAACMIVLATAVGLHFVLQSFYEDVVDTIQIWAVLDWFMAVALLAALAVNYSLQRKLDAQGAGSGPITTEYLAVSVGLYASIIVGLLFFWNWFHFLTFGAGEQSTVNDFIWTLVDPLVAVIIGTTACRLWREASRQ